MDEDMAEVYNINDNTKRSTEKELDGPIPDWLRPIMMNEKMRKVWMMLSRFTLAVNVSLLMIFLAILIYNIVVQLLMIPEILGPLYVIAPVVILFFCFFHSLLGLGWLNSLIYVTMILIGSWAWEEIGVLTGWIFGAYEYSELVPYHISYVPLEIPFSWFIFMYISFCLADIIINGELHNRTRFKRTRKSEIVHGIILSLATGIIIVGWDIAADPMGSTRCSTWIWEHDNGYFFGVPILNFFGWFWTSSCFTFCYLVLEHFNPMKPFHKLSIWHALCPVSFYCGMIFYYFLLSVPEELGLVSVFTMGMPVLCALLRLAQERFKSKPTLDGYDPILEASKSYDDFYHSF